MVERVKDPWRTSDGKTFSSRVEAEKHEGRVELAKWINTAIARHLPDTIHEPEVVETLVAAIQSDSRQFVTLLRKAGIPLLVRDRIAKVKPPAEPKKPAKVEAE